MPSKDRVNPTANAWLETVPGRSSVQERPSGIASATSGPKPRSASLIRLAERLGTTEAFLLERYPEDTLRRMKYPVLEDPQDDGSIRYLHPKGTIEGPRSLTLA